MTGVRVLPYGDRALLLEPEDPADVLALAMALGALGADEGVEEVVPAARTVLVRTARAARSDPTALRRLTARVDQLLAPDGRLGSAAPNPSQERLIVLDVTYDGADLAVTAADVGLDVDGLVRAHCAGHYVVAFCGFSPGFAYLTGLDPALRVARLAEPRARVPAGSVALADEFTGVYPRESPGGWRLLGTTRAALWDTDRDPPAMLAPGTGVRFRAR